MEKFLWQHRLLLRRSIGFARSVQVLYFCIWPVGESVHLRPFKKKFLRLNWLQLFIKHEINLQFTATSINCTHYRKVDPSISTPTHEKKSIHSRTPFLIKFIFNLNQKNSITMLISLVNYGKNDILIYMKNKTFIFFGRKKKYHCKVSHKNPIKWNWIKKSQKTGSPFFILYFKLKKNYKSSKFSYIKRPSDRFLIF